jgi:2-polyprenyl-6-methoxyphenol hydroxylase-like FAD-dependent oxidoreductase
VSAGSSDTDLRQLDVLVAGGGPAGSAAALTLLQHTPLRVGVVERTAYTTWRVGETLPPSVHALLEYLGAGDVLAADAHLAAHGTRAAWGSPDLVARSYLFTGRGHGWHVDRCRFDAALAGRVRARGGDLFLATTVRDVRRIDGEWHVRLSGDGGAGPTRVVARYLIDATGRGAALARRAGGRTAPVDRLTALVVVCPRAGGVDDGATLVESCPAGWWYSASVPGDRAVIAFLTDADLIRRYRLHREDRWEDLVAVSRHTRPRAPRRGRSGPPLVCPASSRLLEPVHGEGWIAVGDAAASFDPLASMGVGYSLSSGIEGARALFGALNGDRETLPAYARSVRRHYREYLELRRRHYLAEPRWPDETFWRRRHAPASPGDASG